MLKVVRYGLYVQLLLGLGRMFGMVANQRVWELHIGIGVIVTLLALYALRPLPELQGDGMRTVARFAPLVTLVVGFALLFGWTTGRGFVMFHMLLGIVTIGLVEMSAGRQRRMLEGNEAAG